MDAKDSFMGLAEKMNSIMPILSQYDFSTALTAVFSITSWRYNRGAQESCLALNLALTEIKNWGSKTIATASELVQLFDSLYQYLQISPFDDPVLPDFGEVKLNYRDRYYSVITGTGHTAPVFAMYQFLERISEVTGMDPLTTELLEYNDNVINLLTKENAPIDTSFDSDARFDPPAFEYYKKVDAFLKSRKWDELNNNLIELLSIENNDVIRSHFFKYTDIIYPLFNPSLIADYQIHLLDLLEEIDVHVITTSVLANKLYSIYNAQDVPANHVFRNCILVENQTPLLKRGQGFVFLGHNSVVVFVDCNYQEDIDQTIKSIQEAKESNALSVVDLDDKQDGLGYRAYNVSDSKKLSVIAFDEYLNIDEDKPVLGEQNKKMVYPAIDLMYMIMISSEIDQIVKFDERERTSNSLVISWGVSDFYTTFMCENGLISKGAIEYNQIYCELETSAAYILSRYMELSLVFPFHIPSTIFPNPEHWKTFLDENSIAQFVRKCPSSPCGAVFKYSNGWTVFSSFDFLSIMKGTNITQARLNLDFLRSIIERFFRDYADQLSEIERYRNVLVQFVCRSLSNADSQHFIHCNIQDCSPKCITVEYEANCNLIENRIETSPDRTIEFTVIKELIHPLVEMSDSSFSALLQQMDIDSKGKKKIDSSTIQVDFFFNTDTFDIKETDTSTLAARKELAKICLKAGIVPGIYEQKEATSIVRKIQEHIVGHLEQLIIPLEREKLHFSLLSALATEQMSAMLNRNSAFLSEHLDDEEKTVSIEKIASLYDNAQAKKSALIYLIETNLYLNDEERGKGSFDDSIMSELLSFAHYIIHLQMCSDMCYFTDSDTTIEVLDDYRIDAKLGSGFMKLQNSDKQRRLVNEPYKVKNDDTDCKYIEKVFEGFMQDTGINFLILESVMHHLSDSSFSHHDVHYDQVAPNVIKANLADLLNDYSSFVKEEVQLDDVKKAYDYLTIVPEKLKTLCGEQHSTLPIWDRENRDNCFNAKPIMLCGVDIVYSPIVMEELRTRWKNGFLQFYPLYKNGLDKTCEAIYEWKSHYEQLISSDVENLLRQSGCEYANHDIDLRRDDREGHHPAINDLGDYDVIGLNTTKKKIYVIECKVLRPIGSVYEHSRQQRSFFFSDKNDEKFQKRIDYFTKVAVGFFSSKGYMITEEYKVEAYMVTNKVFSSYYKKVGFPIVTYGEFKKLLSNSDS